MNKIFIVNNFFTYKCINNCVILLELGFNYKDLIKIIYRIISYDKYT